MNFLESNFIYVIPYCVKDGHNSGANNQGRLRAQTTITILKDRENESKIKCVIYNYLKPNPKF